MNMFVMNFYAILCKSFFFCRWLMVIGIAFEGFALVWYLFLLANAKPCKLFYLILSTFNFLLVPSLLFSVFQIMLLQESIEYSSFCQSTPFCSPCEKEKRATEAAAKVDNFTTGVRWLSYRLLCDSLSVLQINVKAKCIPSVILCEMPFFLVTVYQVRQMATLKNRSLELAKGG